LNILFWFVQEFFFGKFEDKLLGVRGGDGREASHTINTSYFARESRNFAPEDYCSKHMRAQFQLKHTKHKRQPHEQV